MKKPEFVTRGELGCEMVRFGSGAGAGLRWSSKRFELARESMSKKSSKSFALLASLRGVAGVAVGVVRAGPLSARTGSAGRLRTFLAKILREEPKGVREDPNI